jgi:hypothetical protein
MDVSLLPVNISKQALVNAFKHTSSSHLVLYFFFNSFDEKKVKEAYAVHL